MIERIKAVIHQSLKTKEDILADADFLSRMEEISRQALTCFRSGNKLLFCGNGGSAADAQHLAAEFSGRFYSDRDPLPAEALHTNGSYLTAVANDYGFEYIYSRLVKGIGRPGDMLIGLSTSGNSPNVIAAMEQARELDIITVGLTGKGGGKMKATADFLLAVPSTDTPRIQESHIMIGHIICELVESEMFKTDGI